MPGNNADTEKKLRRIDTRVARELGFGGAKREPLEKGPPHHAHWRAHKWWHYRRYRLAGMGRITDAEVGRKLGVTRAAVQNYRKAFGVPHSARVTFGRTKAEQVRELRTLARDHATAREAAAAMEMPLNRVRALAREFHVKLARAEWRRANGPVRLEYLSDGV